MFHANTLENAKDIVGDRGIKPSEGRKNCDFGHNGSFYLTDDYEHAVQWATKHHGKNLSAVVIYTVPTIPPPTLGLDLSPDNKQDDWRTLVFCSRLNKQHKLVRSADMAEWVYGLEASFNSDTDNHDGWSPTPRAERKLQLDIKGWATSCMFNELCAGMVIFPPLRK